MSQGVEQQARQRRWQQLDQESCEVQHQETPGGHTATCYIHCVSEKNMWPTCSTITTISHDWQRQCVITKDTNHQTKQVVPILQGWLDQTINTPCMSAHRERKVNSLWPSYVTERHGCIMTLNGKWITATSEPNTDIPTRCWYTDDYQVMMVKCIA